jgi:hypothetical protein
LTTNPYTHITAQQSFDAAVRGNAQQASKIKLWAIRIFSDIASIFTQPAVLLATSLAITVAALCIPGVNLPVLIIATVVNVIAATTFGFALIETLRGRLSELSKYFAAKAELAKIEINNRNVNFAGQGHLLGHGPVVCLG